VIGHRRRRALALAAVLASVSVDFTGARTPQSPERTLVIDFYALGPDGTGLADLRQDEVTVRINGRTRAVRSLRMVRQAAPPPADPLALAPAVPDPFATNRAAEAGRAFIVVVDDESFRPGRERPIRSALRAFLGALSPRDRVSLWTMPHGGIKVNLTTNHDRVQSEMELVRGHGPERESGSDGACRTRATLQAAEHMLSSLTGGEGPTTVIFFTGGLYGPRRDAPVTRAPGVCELRSDEFQQIGTAAAQARAHFYIVQPEDLQRLPTNRAETLAGEGFATTMNPLEGIEHLSAVTGGHRMSLSRAGDATLLAVARATATYYSVVVDGTASDQPGAHGLEVRLTRAGAEVRSRPFVHVGLGRSTGLIPKALTPPEMVKVGTAFSDLPLRVSGFASLNDSSGGMRLIAAAEPAEPGVTLASASVAYFDTQGKMVGLTNVTPAQKGIPVLAAVVVPPGTYRVRVAAVDEAGRGGAADTEVDAVMTPAGSLRLSSLVLGLWREDAFQPRLQFSTEPVAIAYLDVVGGTAGVPVTAFVEVSQTLNGPPIVTTRLTLEATSGPSRFTASAAVPIGGLPPGDYVVRAIVGVEGQPSGRVVRTLRKTN
jgi:VWFA-related protein